jgi:hypothetical protein
MTTAAIMSSIGVESPAARHAGNDLFGALAGTGGVH